MGDIVPGTVACFIDLENIRFSFLNHYSAELDVDSLLNFAREQGTIIVSHAYADRKQHPRGLLEKMERSGVRVEDVPVRRLLDGRAKSSADMHLQLGIVTALLDNPGIETIVLMSGDQDFIPVVTWAKERFQVRVNVVGVQESTSTGLINVADKVDFLAPPV